MKTYLAVIGFLLFIILSFNCTYQSPFDQFTGRDLISRTDLTSDWTLDTGTQLEVTTVTEPPPAGESNSYKLTLLNILDDKSSNFEASTGSSDAGSWLGANTPDVFKVNSDSQMTGTRYLEIKLRDNQYVYYNFTGDLSSDYVFRFDYQCVIESGAIGISGGPASLSPYDTATQKNFVDVGDSGILFFYIPCQVTTNYQVRFGFRDTLSELFHIYVDNIALFPNSGNDIYKTLNIVDSGQPVINDGTGEKFYEGIYRLVIYAKSDVSDTFTLTLGTVTQKYTLTSGWLPYTVQADILKEEYYLTMRITPTHREPINRVPGSVYITKPKLYFLP